MDKKERLLALIDHYANGNKTQFAKLIGLSPQGLSSWISRNTFDTDLIYSKCVNISPHWLITGDGNMLDNSQDSDLRTPTTSMNPSIGTPYYDVDFIGGFDEVFNSQVNIPATNIVIRGFEKASLWCNVTGHSMEPKINHGDIIALRQCTLNDIQYGEIYAVVLDTIRTIKILRRSPNPDKLRFIPINTNDYDEQEFDKSRIINIFEVIGSISKFF